MKICWLFLGLILFGSCKENSASLNGNDNTATRNLIDQHAETATMVNITSEEQLTEQSQSEDSIKVNSSKENLTIQQINDDDEHESKSLENSSKEKKTETFRALHQQKLLMDSIVFKENEFDYDTLAAGEIVKHKFYFENRNEFPIEVEKTQPDCGCTVPSYPFLPIGSGESGFIGVTYNSVGKQGPQTSILHIKFKGIKEQKDLKLIGFVKSGTSSLKSISN